MILGYALNWPDAVKGLILEAPAGLEEYPAEVTIVPGKTAKLFDPGFGRDFRKWRAVWDQTGILADAKSRVTSRTSATSTTSRSAILRRVRVERPRAATS